MDLSKIKTLIDFVGHSKITELRVTEKDLTVRIFRTPDVEWTLTPNEAAGTSPKPPRETSSATAKTSAFPVKAPTFGILHRAPAPGQEPFVDVGDTVDEGQTLFIIEAMKVLSTVAAPRAGRITQLTEIDGGEVETGDVLAEIA
ncbi:acetyl-CoA carboxylase biotin carboxyl carrier protein subunit [Sinorhizobium garamanticum]|uniref:Biotin carboxyl carrier protein of acetyl-CoA carboxylase n=1 Tax=Sinorhizobium garamanticum TaxID=680247 RepID=A0ABY8DLR8_9HYPH|nr:acetyl-CoA carboxylase biotin carboxyl carrier protein subunit [Sinorhizobium garamanticum]WEX90927.1 acetyl-CoA carboxylase biotin carboxyl carrier protein subunit [Sinorhizobium garamanticum]